MNNQIDKPAPKKQKLDNDNDEYCKFECGRKIDKYRSANTNARKCCEWCSENNKGLPFDIETMEDAEHEAICQCMELNKIDEQKYNEFVTATNEFWLLFNKRYYRSSKQASRWNLHLNALYKCEHPDHDRDTVYLNDVFDGLLVKDIKKMYIKHKNKLSENQEVKIYEFEEFFDLYQYGDSVDLGGIRNTALYILGFSSNNNIENNDTLNELKLLKTWSECGYGIPIEFGDAPRYYFDDEYAIRLFDPLRLFHNEDEKNNDDEYYYMELMQEIENTKIKPNRDFKNYNQEIVDLANYPNDYILIYDPVEGQYESIPRKKFLEKQAMHSMFEANMKVIEWQKTYDFAMKQRRERIHNYCCSACDILNNNLVRKIIDFLL